MPEAEWGFEPALRADVERVALERRLRVLGLTFEQPEEISPIVCDLYRWWHERRGIEPTRLLVESFILLEPWWALRGGWAPFWMVFNTERSAQALARYLDSSPPFDEIQMTLFSHGVQSVGVVPIERWESLVARARHDGGFLGVDERRYPRDFSVFARYAQALQDASRRFPMPAPPLRLAELDAFLEERAPAARRSLLTGASSAATQGNAQAEQA